MKYIVRLFLMGIFSFLAGCGGNGGANETTVDKMIEGMKADTVIVVDVRTPEELQGPLGKIDEAVHIPLYDLKSRMNELKKYKGKKQIDVICRSGNRSQTGAEILNEAGYNAKSVKGGMRAYRKKGN